MTERVPPLSAIFVEPQGSMLDTLRERKAWLEQRMPGQPFCAHPPHCTLLFGDYGPITAWRTALAARAALIPQFEMSTVAWHLFANDALAGGGQTIALRAEMDEALLALQQAVAETLAPFFRGDATSHPLAQREPFATSLHRYGFPFVGAHWIPHFTVGSPLVRSGAPLVAELQDATPHHRFTVGAISIWQVTGEVHTRSDVLALDGANP